MWDWDDNDGMFILCILMKTKNRLSQQIRYWKNYYIFIFIRQRKLNNTNEKIAHLSWCALIALYINNHRHPSQDAAQEDLFLRRWLTNAQHQKRFPKEVAGSLNDIICYSRQLSRKVRIKEYLLDIWNSYSRSEEDPLSLWNCRYEVALSINILFYGIHPTRGIMRVGKILLLTLTSFMLPQSLGSTIATGNTVPPKMVTYEEFIFLESDDVFPMTTLETANDKVVQSYKLISSHKVRRFLLRLLSGK